MVFHLQLTKRDEEVIRALLFCVRLFSLRQVARAWWGSSTAPAERARRRLGKLCEAGWLETHHLLARILPPPTGPLFSWAPGQPDPSFAHVAHLLQARWTTPPRNTLIVVASKRASNLFGGFGGGRVTKLGHVSHDLSLSEAYLWYRTHRPALARRWSGEEALRSSRLGQKLPDAMLLDHAGEPELVVEAGGSYNQHHVAAFHHDVKSRALPYQFW